MDGLTNGQSLGSLITRKALRPVWLALRQAGWLWASVSIKRLNNKAWPGWMPPSGGGGNERTNKCTNERTNERTEILPILQDFVPYRGRCPKTVMMITMMITMMMMIMMVITMMMTGGSVMAVVNCTNFWGIISCKSQASRFGAKRRKENRV